MIFHDRTDAGKKLASKLVAYKNDPDAVVLGLPRGGVVTAFEIAQGLHLPLDIVVPRKISAPGNAEFAIGAITEDGKGIFSNEIIDAYGISSGYIEQEIEKEKKESQRRLKLYRDDLLPLDLKDKTVLLVDDGIATGLTMQAAIISVRSKNPRKIIVAAPVMARDASEKLKHEADEVVALDVPALFMAVGQFYEQFDQTTDKKVVDLMLKVRNNTGESSRK